MNKKRKNWKEKWKNKQNIKNLKKRTIRKKILKIRKKNYNNYIKTTSNSHYDKKNSEFQFLAPENLSIMDNSEETIKYFNDVIKKIKGKVHHKLTINFLLNNVKELTIDAVMYMLAITKNTKKFHHAKGSYPTDEKAKAVFMNSGFLKYVLSNKNIINPKPNEDIQIRMSNNYNDSATTCREINQTLIERYGIKRSKLTFLYDILSEMMINTNEHAYNSNNYLINNWYVYVALEEDKVSFSFLDTGSGIPNTVAKNFKEKIDFLGLVKHSDLILSALLGQFKSSTKKAYRGKGLPKFTKYNKNKRIHNFKIVSGKGMVIYNNEKNKYITYNLDKELVGTVYYFEVDVSILKEEQNANNN